MGEPPEGGYMLFSSMYYFLYYGAISILFPFLALFYQSQGMTGGQIGLLAAISPIISFSARRSGPVPRTLATATNSWRCFPSSAW